MSDQPTLGPVIRLSGLKMGSAYRFRMAVSVRGLYSQEEVEKGPWLGLKGTDIGTAESIMLPEVSANLADLLKGATLYRDANTVFISWQMAQPLYGWVELQEIEGLDLQSSFEPTAGNAGGHPLLRSAENLSIEACYQCHPESTLGTSHPVRLYSGQDVIIPPDLPTVDGMLTCVTCHDPHGADGKMLVRTVVKTRLCVTCHIKFKNRSRSTMFD